MLPGSSASFQLAKVTASLRLAELSTESVGFTNPEDCWDDSKPEACSTFQSPSEKRMQLWARDGFNKVNNW